MRTILGTISFRIVCFAAVTVAGLGIARSAIADDHCGHAGSISCSATVTGALSSADCVAPDSSFYDLWEFSGTAGQEVVIIMTSRELDTYLILVDPSQNAVAQNDDFGDDTNSRITFTLTSTGTWTIVANSFEPLDTGSYNLALSCTAGIPSSNVSYIPIAGHQPGANNTNFISDVRIVNLNSSAETVTLDFFPLNPAGVAGPTATSTLTIAAGEQVVLNDVVLTRFVTTGLGVIRTTSARPVEVISRIINDQRPMSGGTTGFAFRARTMAQLKASGTLPFLSSASVTDTAAGLGLRTNLGFFNPTGSAVTVTFTAHRTFDGVPFGSNTLTVPPFASGLSSIFNVLTSVAPQDRAQADYYVTYQASAPIFIYASITDNKTGDGVFVD